MIDETGHPTGHLVIPLKEETTMLKTISATLLAVSVLAAPAMAASSGRTAHAPVIKGQMKTSAKASVLNANARMGHHYRYHHHHRHFRFHNR
jgi:hypothetical protein